MNKQSKLLLGLKPDDRRIVRHSIFVNKGRVYPYASKRPIGRATRRNKEKS